MKNFLLFGAVMMLMTSCGNSSQEEQTEAEETTTMEMSHAAPVDHTKMDPVCEMEWEQGWTESTVYMGDTIRFCSENCKTAFVARPEKYIASKK